MIETSSNGIVVDNRGTEDCPFGYVYLNQTRVGFSRGNGVWATNGWPSEYEDLVAAQAHLDEVMPGWNDMEESI